jgi:hypothetical protein
MSDIDSLINNFDNLNVNNSLIRAYVEYNNYYHNNEIGNIYFYNFINKNNEHNEEILLEINNLFRLYTNEVKEDLLKYNIYNINEKSEEFLICILAYIDNFFDPEYYHNIYLNTIQKLKNN